MTEDAQGGLHAEVSTIEASRPSLATSDRVTGLIVAALMLSSVLLVSRQIVRIATGSLPPSVGVQAPAFTGTALDGGTIELAHHGGKVVLLDFWATWCPPCVAAMPTLQAMHERYGADGLVILGINQEPYDTPKVRTFVREHRVSFPTVIDPGSIAGSYGVVSFPTSFLIDRRGQVVSTWRGPPSERTLRTAVERALGLAP